MKPNPTPKNGGYIINKTNLDLLLRRKKYVFFGVGGGRVTPLFEGGGDQTK